MRPQQLLALCLLVGIACSLAVAQDEPQRRKHDGYSEYKREEYDEYKPSDNYGEYKENYGGYGDYNDYPKFDQPPPPYGGYPPRPPPATPPPSPPPYNQPNCTLHCLEAGFPPCVNCTSGVAVVFNASCTTTSTSSYCVRIDPPHGYEYKHDYGYGGYGYGPPEKDPGYWGCRFTYNRNNTPCGGTGGCELGNGTCTGTSPNCRYNLRNESTPCDPDYGYGEPEGPCWNTPKCDGINPTCPDWSKAPNGQPCGPDGGLYEEAYLEGGDLAHVSAVTPAKAKEEHWDVCHRCWHGKCQPFKYHWWSTKPKPPKTPKKPTNPDYGYGGEDYYNYYTKEEYDNYGKKDEYKYGDNDKYDGAKYNEKGHYDEEPENWYGSHPEHYHKDGKLKYRHYGPRQEYYPTKVSLQGKSGTEPAIFCKKPYDRYKK